MTYTTEFASATSLAILNIGRYGDTDVLPFPSENHVMHDRPTDVANAINVVHQDLESALTRFGTAPVSTLAPAGYTGFRWVAQIDPLWNAYYLSLALFLAPRFETIRMPSSVVYSHRLDPLHTDARLFQPNGFREFTLASKRLADAASHVVVADIADFYSRIYHHRLENAMQDIPEAADVPDRVMSLLASWGRRRSYGIPVGGPASRILSEILLNRTDQLLRAHGVNFIRYADDYRIFAGSQGEAFSLLALLSEILLSNEGLALTKAKTRISTSREYCAQLRAVDPDEDTDETVAPQDKSPSPDEIRRTRAARSRKLLGFSVRFDPYSPNAVEEYEDLKRAVDGLDLADLFMAELRKSRIDTTFTRKILLAVRFANPRTKALIASSVADNLELLAPLMPQVLMTLRNILAEADPDLSEEVRMKVFRSIAVDSHLFRIGANLGFAVRLLADDLVLEHEQYFAESFDHAPVFVKRDIVIGMARAGKRFWLSDRLADFQQHHPNVRRAILLGSYSLGDEGRHWRRAVSRELTPFDEIVRDWAKDAKEADNSWKVPL